MCAGRATSTDLSHPIPDWPALSVACSAPFPVIWTLFPLPKTALSLLTPADRGELGLRVLTKLNTLAHGSDDLCFSRAPLWRLWPVRSARVLLPRAAARLRPRREFQRLAILDQCWLDTNRCSNRPSGVSLRFCGTVWNLHPKLTNLICLCSFIGRCPARDRMVSLVAIHRQLLDQTQFALTRLLTCLCIRSSRLVLSVFPYICSSSFVSTCHFFSLGILFQ